MKSKKIKQIRYRVINNTTNNYNSFLYKPSQITVRQDPAMTSLWDNAAYSYNKNYLKNLPSADITCNELIRDFFSINPLSNNPYGKKTKHSIRRFIRLSLDKILVSKPVIKQNNDQVLITVFLYNKKKNTVIRSISGLKLLLLNKSKKLNGKRSMSKKAIKSKLNERINKVKDNKNIDMEKKLVNKKKYNKRKLDRTLYKKHLNINLNRIINKKDKGYTGNTIDGLETKYNVKTDNRYKPTHPILINQKKIKIVYSKSDYIKRKSIKFYLVNKIKYCLINKKSLNLLGNNLFITNILSTTNTGNKCNVIGKKLDNKKAKSYVNRFYHKLKYNSTLNIKTCSDSYYKYNKIKCLTKNKLTQFINKFNLIFNLYFLSKEKIGDSNTKNTSLGLWPKAKRYLKKNLNNYYYVWNKYKIPRMLNNNNMSNLSLNTIESINTNNRNNDKQISRLKAKINKLVDYFHHKGDGVDNKLTTLIKLKKPFKVKQVKGVKKYSKYSNVLFKNTAPTLLKPSITRVRSKSTHSGLKRFYKLFVLFNNIEFNYNHSPVNYNNNNDYLYKTSPTANIGIALSNHKISNTTKYYSNILGNSNLLLNKILKRNLAYNNNNTYNWIISKGITNNNGIKIKRLINKTLKDKLRAISLNNKISNDKQVNAHSKNVILKNAVNKCFYSLKEFKFSPLELFNPVTHVHVWSKQLGIYVKKPLPYNNPSNLFRSITNSKSKANGSILFIGNNDNTVDINGNDSRKSNNINFNNINIKKTIPLYNKILGYIYLNKIRKNILLLNKINRIDHFVTKYIKVLSKPTQVCEATQGRALSYYDSNNLKTLYKLQYVKQILDKELLYIYYMRALAFNNTLFKSWFLTPLSNVISKIYNKKVVFNLVNLKYMYLNSDIFLQAITLKLRNYKENRLNMVLRKALTLIKISTANPYARDKKSSQYNYVEQHFNNYKTLNNSIFKNIYNNSTLNFDLSDWYKSLQNNVKLNYNKDLITPGSKKHLVKSLFVKGLNNTQANTLAFIKYKSIFGLKLVAAGRLTKRSTASRAVYKIRYKGGLRNVPAISRDNNPSLNSNLIYNLQYSSIISKTRNGSFGVKSWINNN